MTGRVHELHQAPLRPGGASIGGNGSDMHGRVSALEAHLQHIATKRDVQEVSKTIAEREASLQRWLIGILLASLGTAAVALIKLFLTP